MLDKLPLVLIVKFTVNHFLAQIPSVYLLYHGVANQHSCKIVLCPIRVPISILVGNINLVIERYGTISGIN